MAYDSEAQAGLYSFTKPQTSAFLNIFEPKAVVVRGKASGEPKYSVSFILDNDKSAGDHAGIRKAAVEVAKVMWPGRDLKELAWPWADGTKLADKAKDTAKPKEFYRDKTIITSRSKFAPVLGVIEGNQLVEYLDERRPLCKSAFYMGVQCLATIKLVAYTGVGANPDGVNAYINQLVSLKRGERIGSQRASLAETFKGYVGEHTDFDPTAGGDDEEF